MVSETYKAIKDGITKISEQNPTIRSVQEDYEVVL